MKRFIAYGPAFDNGVAQTDDFEKIKQYLGDGEMQIVDTETGMVSGPDSITISIPVPDII